MTRFDTRDTLALIEGFFVIAAFMFFLSAAVGGDPMLPEVYGAATVIPAEAWAMFLLVTHAVSAWGLWSRRFGIGGIGAFASIPAYVAFAVLAAPAIYGDIIVIFSAVVHAPMQLVIAFDAYSASSRRE